MTGYTKLFSSILDSTVWDTPTPTKVVWITMLAMCDQHGEVASSVPGLAKRAGVTRDECESALALFLAPDQDSRSREFEGRRIEQIDGGWALLNHSKYRQLMSEEDRRAKTAERVRRHRSRGDVTPTVTLSNASVTLGNAGNDKQSPQASADSQSQADQNISDRDCETPLALATAGKKRRPSPPRKDALAHQIASASTWDAYSVAYEARYSSKPTRNAKVNGQVANFVQRVAAAEAPHIAAHYVSSNNSRYIAAGHAWGPLLQDAEKMRTEWITGRSSTAHAARQADKQAGRGDEYREMFARLAAEDRAAGGEP